MENDLVQNLLVNRRYFKYYIQMLVPRLKNLLEKQYPCMSIKQNQ